MSLGTEHRLYWCLLTDTPRARVIATHFCSGHSYVHWLRKAKLEPKRACGNCMFFSRNSMEDDHRGDHRRMVEIIEEERKAT